MFRENTEFENMICGYFEAISEQDLIKFISNNFNLNTVEKMANVISTICKRPLRIGA